MEWVGGAGLQPVGQEEARREEEDPSPLCESVPDPQLNDSILDPDMGRVCVCVCVCACVCVCVSMCVFVCVNILYQEMHMTIDYIKVKVMWVSQLSPVVLGDKN